MDATVITDVFDIKQMILDSEEEDIDMDIVSKSYNKKAATRSLS